MLAILGFIVLTAFGLLGIFAAYSVFVMTALFGKVEWFPVGMFCGGGVGFLWLAYTHSPFHVTFAGG